MAVNKRLGAVFVSGLLLGAATVAGARKNKKSTPISPPAPERPASQGSAPQPQPQPRPEPLKTSMAPPPQPELDRDLYLEQPEREFVPQSAAPASRRLLMLATGVVLTAAAAAGAWLMLDSRPLLFSGPVKAPVIAAAPPPPSFKTLAECPVQPATVQAGQKDGQFPAQADVSGLTATEIGSFIVIGKEAAAAGRVRDAEVAFLMSCRVADTLKGAGSVESADAKYQLGLLYARAALDAASAGGASRAELLGRAELFYTDSMNGYVAKFGESHEKSRFAADGLAQTRQALAAPQAAQSAPEPEKPGQTLMAKPSEPVGTAGDGTAEASSAAVPRPLPRKAEAAKTMPVAPQISQAPNASREPGPSFDCSKARSVPEKLICSDAELAQLDRELGRVYARAKNATPNRAAFLRQNDLEWRRRESICRDRGCLQRWYAYRRDQLINVIEGRAPA